MFINVHLQIRNYVNFNELYISQLESLQSSKNKAVKINDSTQVHY